MPGFLHQIKRPGCRPGRPTSTMTRRKRRSQYLGAQWSVHLPQSQFCSYRRVRPYQWRICGLSKRVVTGLAKWLRQLPEIVDLKNAPLAIQQVRLFHPATTYKKLANVEVGRSLSLSFTTPTSSSTARATICRYPGPSMCFTVISDGGMSFRGSPIDQADFFWIG